MNIESLMAGIDMFDLPATFRDAITITRKLGIKYLWIDSLCIIQDSREDWQSESTKMGNYYRDCFLNISALDAAEARIGMLNPRATVPTVHLAERSHLRQASRSWQDVFQNSPLSLRAWVLQERLISTRVLHFAQDDLFWECSTCSVRESDITEHKLLNESVAWSDENFKRSLHFAEVESCGLATSTVHLYEALIRWYQIITQYSKLNITYTMDIFPAISGIARRIQTVTGFEYFAGIWRQDINAGLLWHKNDRCTVSEHYTAPSWSWAAMPGPVAMLFPLQILQQPTYPVDHILDATIIQCQVALSSDDPLGPISSGNLLVRGITKPIWYKSSHGDPPFNDSYLKLVLDVFDEGGIPIGTGYLDLCTSNDTGQRKSLALAIKVFQEEEIKGHPHVLYFLLIEPTGASPNEYRRVGIGITADRLLGEAFGVHPFRGCRTEEIVLA